MREIAGRRDEMLIEATRLMRDEHCVSGMLKLMRKWYRVGYEDCWNGLCND